MGIWTDIAQWRGPTPNRGGAMVEWRGVVIHIAEGSYEGTISWQLNDSSNVSSHFVVAKDGRIAQIVDTDQVAWTQAGGNGRWLSIENEGFSGQSLTAAQLEANAKIIAKAHKIYGFPLVLAESPNDRGIGWHGMGGTAWGNHPNCPGVPIRNQRPEMIAVAQQILGGGVVQPQGADVALIVRNNDNTYWVLGGDGVPRRLALKSAKGINDVGWIVSGRAGVPAGIGGVYANVPIGQEPWIDIPTVLVDVLAVVPDTVASDTIRTIVREELAKDPAMTPEEVAALTEAAADAAERGAAAALDGVVVTATIQRPE